MRVYSFMLVFISSSWLRVILEYATEIKSSARFTSSCYLTERKLPLRIDPVHMPGIFHYFQQQKQGGSQTSCTTGIRYNLCFQIICCIGLFKNGTERPYWLISLFQDKEWYVCSKLNSNSDSPSSLRRLAPQVCNKQDTIMIFLQAHDAK